MDPAFQSQSCFERQVKQKAKPAQGLSPKEIDFDPQINKQLSPSISLNDKIKQRRNTHQY